MKKHSFWVVALFPLAFACQMAETEAPERPPLTALVVHAGVEVSEDEEDTKVFMDDQCRLFWNAGDQISFFPKTTQNCAFTFQGNDGDKSGDFSTIYAEDELATAIANYYAAYPFRDDNTVSSEGLLGLTLLADQTYCPDSFDSHSQLMVAVNDAPTLNFKNVCCAVALQLYGSDVKIKSVSLTGAGGQILAGPMHVTAGDEPTFTFTSAATATTITLTAATPVALNATTPTRFWMVLPPVSFPNGFTVTVTDEDGYTLTKSTTKSITLERNKAYRMAAFEVRAGGVLPTAQGLYLAGSQPYQFSAATDQVNLFEYDNQLWVRYITPGSLTVREIGPIPSSVTAGDTFQATYTETIAGVQSATKTYPLEVQSLDAGILTLLATSDNSCFVLRY